MRKIFLVLAVCGACNGGDSDPPGSPSGGTPAPDGALSPDAAGAVADAAAASDSGPAPDGGPATDARGSDAAPGTGPVVVGTSPVAGATNVEPGVAITATFSADVAADSLGGASFVLRHDGVAVPIATVAYDAPSRTATFTPATHLSLGGTYTATLDDPALAAPRTWSFTIHAPPEQAHA